MDSVEYSEDVLMHNPHNLRESPLKEESKKTLEAQVTTNNVKELKQESFDYLSPPQDKEPTDDELPNTETIKPTPTISLASNKKLITSKEESHEGYIPPRKSDYVLTSTTDHDEVI